MLTCFFFKRRGEGGGARVAHGLMLLLVTDIERRNKTKCLPWSYFSMWTSAQIIGGRRGRHRLVIGFTTTSAIGAYHH